MGLGAQHLPGLGKEDMAERLPPAAHALLPAAMGVILHGVPVHAAEFGTLVAKLDMWGTSAQDALSRFMKALEKVAARATP